MRKVNLTSVFLSLFLLLAGGNTQASPNPMGSEAAGVATPSRAIIDSTKYFENFDKGYGYIPDGSLDEKDIYGSQWSYWGMQLDDNYYAYSHSTPDDNKFITPLLSVTAGETFYFEAAKMDENSYVKVFYSKDRKQWTLADSIPATSMTDSMATPYTHALTPFTVNNIPAGNYYIGLAGRVIIDNLNGFDRVPVAHDVIISATSVPTNAEINEDVTCSYTLKNVKSIDEPAGTYTAKLYVGDEVITAQAPQITASRGTAILNFSYTPHKTGTVPIYARFEFSDSFTVVSDTVNLSVREEEVPTNARIGTPDKTDKNSPISLYYKNSKTETVFDKSMLTALSAGTKIHRIVFKGYYTSTDYTVPLKVWIQNTTDAPAASSTNFTPTDTSATGGMTKIFDGDYTFTKRGSSSATDTMLVIDLPEPFTYDGNNLRLAMCSERKNDKSVYFEVENDKTHTYVNNNDSQSSYLRNKYVAGYTPVAYFDIEKTASSYSGVVKDDKDSLLAGVPIVLKSGNVIYSDTTDANGNFSMTIFRDALTYNLSINQPNYEPLEKELNVLGDVKDTLVLKAATGLHLESFDIPTKGEVNSKLTATATVINDISTDILPDDYTAEMYVDGALAAEAKKDTVKSMKAVSFNFDYMPHASGTFPAYIKFTYNGNEYVTDTVDIVVEKEQANKDLTACDSTMVTYSAANAPWGAYFQYYQSVIAYSPEEMGVPAGTKITRIRFRGRISGSKSGKNGVSLFIGNLAENVTDTAMANAVYADTLNMTRLSDIQTDSISYTYSIDQTTHDIFDYQIPDGFIYNGGYLALVFKCAETPNSWDQVYYVCDDQATPVTAYTRYTDSGVLEAKTFGTAMNMPVMFFSIDNHKDLEGTIVNTRHEPVSGASLTLKSGDVEYYATTDSVGKYRLSISKPMLDYKLAVNAKGYVPDTVDVAFADTISTLVVNDTLLSYVTANILVKGKDKKNLAQTVSLAGANVQLKEADGTVLALTTNDDGKAAANSLKETDTYTIIASADGYKKDSLTVTLADKDTTIELTLDAVKTLRVSVKNSAGDAIASASLQLTVADADTEGTTADDGTYTFENVEADDNATLVASADGYKNDTVSVSFSDSADVSLTITLTKFVALSGTVMGQDRDTVNYITYDAAPLSGATVKAYDSEGNEVATATTDAEGKYTLTGLDESKSYTLIFSATGYISDTLAVQTTATDSPVTTVTLYTPAYTGIDSVKMNGNTLRGSVYGINGQYIGRDLNTRDLRRGVYIVNGKKITIK